MALRPGALDRAVRDPPAHRRAPRLHSARRAGRCADRRPHRAVRRPHRPVQGPRRRRRGRGPRPAHPGPGDPVRAAGGDRAHRAAALLRDPRDPVAAGRGLLRRRIGGPRHRRRRPRPGHDRMADPHPGRAPAGDAAAGGRGTRRDRAGRRHRHARRLCGQRRPGPIHLPGYRLPGLSADDRRFPAGHRDRPRARPGPAAAPARDRAARDGRRISPVCPTRTVGGGSGQVPACGVPLCLYRHRGTPHARSRPSLAASPAPAVRPTPGEPS